MGLEIRSFQPLDTDAVVWLWQQCELARPWNDPYKDIQRKKAYVSSFEADDWSSEVHVWSSKVKLPCIASNAPRTEVQVSPSKLGCLSSKIEVLGSEVGVLGFEVKW